MNISALGIEGIIGLFAIASLAIIYALRSPEAPAGESNHTPVSVPEFNPKPVDETKENLDKTRYQ